MIRSIRKGTKHIKTVQDVVRRPHMRGDSEQLSLAMPESSQLQKGTQHAASERRSTPAGCTHAQRHARMQRMQRICT